MKKIESKQLPSLEKLSLEDIEAGKKLFSKKLSFKLGIKNQEDLPQNNLPEVAFAGRSNVGKSSLINNLTFQKNIARVSKKPGSTQQINFFEISEVLRIIDLPGYGFAKVSKSDKEEWDKLIEQYFITSPSLNRVFLLIDGRRGIKDIDLNFMKNLEKFAIVFEVIVTKIDKLDYKNARNLVSEIERINSTFTTAFPRVILTSCINNNGLDKLRAEIFKLLN
mgnify:CR=1 FL=1